MQPLRQLSALKRLDLGAYTVDEWPVASATVHDWPADGGRAVLAPLCSSSHLAFNTNAISSNDAQLLSAVFSALQHLPLDRARLDWQSVRALTSLSLDRNEDLGSEGVCHLSDLTSLIHLSLNKQGLKGSRRPRTHVVACPDQPIS